MIDYIPIDPDDGYTAGKTPHVQRVIVIETAIDGGTMNTVNAALKAHKPVGCCIYSEEHYQVHTISMGNNKMLVEKIAHPPHDLRDVETFLDLCLSKKSIGAEHQSLF